MTECHEHNNELQPQPETFGNEFDAAGRSLSDALGVSFVILKIIMAVLLLAFGVSCFKTVSSEEQALVLRFGKIRGIGENRILGPGPHLILPYPLEEIIRIPVAKKTDLSINTFWYYQHPSELLADGPLAKPRIFPTLHPIRDGYSLTRSQKDDISLTDSDGSDYNIVHTKWKLTYQIEDPERFFRNVYVNTDHLMTGQNYGDIIEENVSTLLTYLAEDVIVTALANYTIEEVISSADRIPKHVNRLLQEKLDTIESGVKIVSVMLTQSTWPRQVDYAFIDFIKARQIHQKKINEAMTYAANTLNETEGLVAAEIAQARAYRKKVVETTKANADYLKQILPEYRKRPKLVIQNIYQDAIRYVLNNADENIIIGSVGNEIRLILSRDPAIKPKGQEEK